MTVARKTAPLIAVLVVGALLAPAVGAEPTGRVAPAGPVATEFPPEVPVVDGWWGTAVAIDGGRFLIGAPYDDMVVGETTYLAVGSAWLYEWNGGAWDGTEFRPPYWVDGDDSYKRFGESVAIEGDTFVVGAPYHGSAWVYEYDGGWSAEELVDNDSPVRFGNAVAVSGNRVAVSAPGNSDDAGSAYVFELVGEAWVETELPLTGAAGGDQAGLGNSGVAIDGDTVVIGVPQGVPYGEGNGPGRVHVFTWSGDAWAEQVLAPAGASLNDAVGWSVDIEGDQIVVGAPGDDTVDTNAGAVYVYEKVGGVWTQATKITLSDGEAFDTFGWAVALSGDRLATGAPGRDDVGAVFWFSGSGGTWADEHPRPRFDSDAAFGRAVDIDGERIIAGGPYYNAASKEDSGTAFLLEFQFCDGRAATLVGTDDPDTLVGTSKNDVIVGRGGDDTISGGGGSDFICAGEGDDQVDGEGGNDRVFGEAGNDTLLGSAGNDLLSGGLGHDTMTGGAGDDTLNGGRGADTVIFSDSPAGVTIDLAALTASGHGTDRITRCEHIYGSDFDDDITGNGAKNRIYGLDGADRIDGGDRRDLLTGGNGDDRIFGGLGNDALSGNVGDDFLKGQDGDDSLKGGTGNDELYGGAGTDTLNGGSGTDVCKTGETLIACE